jgi:glycosyltransferase involved in cell wall biosynthesis
VLRNDEAIASSAKNRQEHISLRKIGNKILGDGFVKSLLRPIYRHFVKPIFYPQAQHWREKWKSISKDVICLLPNVACIDQCELDDYYYALAEHPLVWVVHDLHPMHFPEQWGRHAAEAFRRRCVLLASASKRIIVHNQYTKRDVMARLGVDPRHVIVAKLPSILPVVDRSSMPSADVTFRKYGIKQPYALWASSNTFAHKNHERLLKAWRLMRDNGHKLQLVCTGWRGPRWKYLLKMIGELGLEEMVIFTGDIPREDLYLILENARLAVCPTLFEGGGSGPAAEAIMEGIPLACSNIPQTREQFDSRDDLCSWFDPMNENAIYKEVEHIMNNYQNALERAMYAKRTYPEMRSWDKVAELYWKAIEEI